jgi:site-specific recombinase XerD
MTEPGKSLVIATSGTVGTVPRDTSPTPYWVYLTSLGSDESRRTMRSCLNHIAGKISGERGDAFPWHQLRYEHTTVIRAMIVNEGKSPSHVNKHLSALRGVLREAWRLGLMTAEDYQRAIDVRELKGHREPAGRNIHGDEVSAMLTVCAAADGPAGIRDSALIAVLQSTGMRRAEAASALIERYDPRERSLRVIGKGNKERTVYIHPGAVPMLERWLVTIGERRGPIFRPVDRWEHIKPRHMTPRGIGLTIDQRRQQAGLQPLSTHDFRRTLGGDFLDAGGDLAQLQKLFGHASATTTVGYDRRPGRELRTAVDRLPILGPAKSGR